MENKIINNVRCFAPTSRTELIEYAMENKIILIAVNAEKILHATEETRNIINRNVGYPDGIGAVWGLNQKGIKNVVKIPGVELWLDIIAHTYNDKSFYLIGGTEEVIQETVKKLQVQYPGIHIANYRNGYLKTKEERDALKLDVLEKKPDVIFVAMGSPKQEFLMEELHQIHPAVYQGLGGSFDVYNGNVKRAPKWWVNNNLEWAYRLINQPSRLKRQLPLIKFYLKLKSNQF